MTGETGCKYGDCFGTENGNLGVKIWPSLCTRYPTDATTNGLYCRDVNGDKRLYVAPDAGVNTIRQERGMAVSGPVDGPAISSFALNGGTSGTALINTRNGATPLNTEWQINPRGVNCGAVQMRNFSCARNWFFNVLDEMSFAVDISAGANAKFVISTSTDYTVWSPRRAVQVDNTGLGARRVYVFLSAGTWITVPAGGGASIDSRVTCSISGGSATLSEFGIAAVIPSGAYY